MSPQQQRAESPPYVTSDASQSMDAYQEAFWQRQLARVEEQVTLPEEQMAAITAAREQSAAMAAASSSTSAEGAEMLTEQQNFSDADLATTAKALMELFKPQAGQLPLARIKKVMKASDDDVKMISAEAPILFARACEIFIADLTCRSYMHATANRRRTVQHSDVVAAVAGSNLFDFLVDIVPRSSGEGGSGSGGATAAGGSTKATSQRGSGRTTDEEAGAEEMGQP